MIYEKKDYLNQIQEKNCFPNQINFNSIKEELKNEYLDVSGSLFCGGHDVSSVCFSP